jgi:phospholipid transport system substrate-binding protein
MILYRVLLIAWAMLFGLLAAWSALAGQATDQLKPAIERVVRALEDPALKGEGKAAERRRALRDVTDTAFDWTEMARRALGPHWNARSEAEREEFVALFRELLERAYVTKIDRYAGEKIVYAGEAVDADTATVKTRIFRRQGQDVPVDYRLVRRGDRWRVYDVVVEGIGLLGNYRTQFNEIIRTSSYQELLKRLKSLPS